MKSIHTEIEINADIQRVWNTLMRFEDYPDWNPFIISMAGEPKVGSTLEVQIKPPGQKAMRFKPTCLVCNEKQELRWLGHLFVKGIFDGEHVFRLKEIGPGKTKLIQSENFKGLLLGMIWKKIHTSTLQGFEMMNLKLKERAEALG